MTVTKTSESAIVISSSQPKIENTKNDKNSDVKFSLGLNETTNASNNASNNEAVANATNAQKSQIATATTEVAEKIQKKRTSQEIVNDINSLQLAQKNLDEILKIANKIKANAIELKKEKDSENLNNLIKSDSENLLKNINDILLKSNINSKNVFQIDYKSHGINFDPSILNTKFDTASLEESSKFESTIKNMQSDIKTSLINLNSELNSDSQKIKTDRLGEIKIPAIVTNTQEEKKERVDISTIGIMSLLGDRIKEIQEREKAQAIANTVTATNTATAEIKEANKEKNKETEKVENKDETQKENEIKDTKDEKVEKVDSENKEEIKDENDEENTISKSNTEDKDEVENEIKATAESEKNKETEKVENKDETQKENEIKDTKDEKVVGSEVESNETPEIVVPPSTSNPSDFVTPDLLRSSDSLPPTMNANFSSGISTAQRFQNFNNPFYETSIRNLNLNRFRNLLA